MAFGTMDSRRDTTAYTDHGVVILADHDTHIAANTAVATRVFLADPKLDSSAIASVR
jgi:hypothetical protein